MRDFDLYKNVMDQVQPPETLEQNIRTQLQGKKYRRRRPMRAAAIAVAAVLVLTVSAGAAYVVRNWDEMFSSYFQPTEQAQQALDNAMQDINVTAEGSGVTFTVKQILGDSQSMYVTMDITLPEDMQPEVLQLSALRALAESNGYLWDGDEDNWGVLQRFKTECDQESGTAVGISAIGVAQLGDQAELGTLKEAGEAVIETGNDFRESPMPTDAIRWGNGASASSDGYSTRLLDQKYDAETGTLTVMLLLSADESLAGKKCALALCGFQYEDITGYYSEPDNGERKPVETTFKGLDTPILLEFTADYTPYEQNYTVWKDGEEIGTMQLSPVMIYIEIQGEKSEEEYSTLESAALRTKEKPILYNDFVKIKPVITLKDGTQIETKQDNAAWSEQTEICYYRPEQLFPLENVAEVQLEGFTFVPAES